MIANKEVGILKNPKTLICASYLSILFAPVIVPLFIFFTTKNEDVKIHSKRAFISHLIPVCFSFLLFLLSFFAFFATTIEKFSMFFLVVIIFITLYFVLYISLIIWNVLQAIRSMKLL